MILDSVYSYDIPLSQLVHDFQATHGRAPRAAVDGTFWIVATEKAMTKAQGASGSSMYFNPDKPFYERLLNLLLVGVDVIVVFDGPKKLAKVRDKGNGISSNRQFQLMKDFMDVCQWLGVQTIIAYAEGEAECARLQQQGSVDFVISEDSDCLVYGATCVLRRYKSPANTSKGTVKTLDQIMTVTDLSITNRDLSVAMRTDSNILHIIKGAMTENGKDGFILLALLTGGDHHLGISKIGPNHAARVCFPPDRYATPFLDIFRRSALPYDFATMDPNNQLSSAKKTTNFETARVDQTELISTNNVYFKFTEDDELVLGSIIDNLFRELKHGREEDEQETTNLDDIVNDIEPQNDSKPDVFTSTASVSPTKKGPLQAAEKVSLKKAPRRMGLALDGNLFENFPDHRALYYYLYNTKSHVRPRRLSPRLTAEQLVEKQRRVWFRRAPAMPELLKYWHESNWNMATFMSKLIFNWYCSERHHSAATALPVLLKKNMTSGHDASSTETTCNKGDDNQVEIINDDIDNIQLRMTTTNKQFNAQSFPPKYKVQIACPLKFLREYLSVAAPQFSLDQFIDKLHMSSVYLDENTINYKAQQQQKKEEQPAAPKPRRAIRNGGTAAGTRRDRMTIAANDAQLAHKLKQPCEFEVTRDSVDSVSTHFVRCLVERMHARSATKSRKKQQLPQPKARRHVSDNSGSTEKITTRTGSTGYGDVATLLKKMSAAPKTGGIVPVNTTETVDANSSVVNLVADRVKSSDVKLSSICALLESSDEEAPAPPQKRRLTAGIPRTAIRTSLTDLSRLKNAKRTNSGSRAATKRAKTTGSTSSYYKIDSFFESTASPTASLVVLPQSRPNIDMHEVISIGSSDTDNDDDNNNINNYNNLNEFFYTTKANDYTGSSAIKTSTCDLRFETPLLATNTCNKSTGSSIIIIGDTTDDDENNTEADIDV